MEVDVDAVLTAIIQSAPQLGISGVVITVLVLLIRREASAEARHAAELERISKLHDAELAEAHAENTLLRKQVAGLHAAVDRERVQRHDAEDRAAEAHRRPKRGSGP